MITEIERGRPVLGHVPPCGRKRPTVGTVVRDANYVASIVGGGENSRTGGGLTFEQVVTTFERARLKIPHADDPIGRGGHDPRIRSGDVMGRHPAVIEMANI